MKAWILGAALLLAGCDDNTGGAILPVGTACDAAYDVCIAPPPPDLDCRDIEDRGFAVRTPDPHSFDNDGDGIGCE